jgi:uncharacterized membrane protein
MALVQFRRRLRERHFRFHRTLGKLYIAGALVGGLGGLYMAQFSASGTPSDLGFALLAIGVLTTTTLAFLRIRSGNVQSHREWMTRSYALIFAAVKLRPYLPVLEAAFGEHTGHAIVAWACWLPQEQRCSTYLCRARATVVVAGVSYFGSGRGAGRWTTGRCSGPGPGAFGVWMRSRAFTTGPRT